MSYLWIKAAHVVSVVLFLGGTFTLLLTCAALGTRSGREVDAAVTLRAVVRRWDARVTQPAMIAAWAFGIWAAVIGGVFSDFWLQAKLVFVLLISGFHGTLAGRLRRVDQQGSPGTTEPGLVPVGLTLAAVSGIVVLAVVKPG